MHFGSGIACKHAMQCVSQRASTFAEHARHCSADRIGGRSYVLPNLWHFFEEMDALGFGHCLQACVAMSFPTIKHGFLSSVGQSVRLWTSRLGVRASRGRMLPYLSWINKGRDQGLSWESKVPNFEGQHAPRSTHGGTRTRNLLLRREAPYPLGHTSAELMQSKAPFGGRERSEEAWGGLVEGSKKCFQWGSSSRPWDWDPRCANCAIEQLVRRWILSFRIFLNKSHQVSS